ncbi:MAG: sulfite exporter TauE/SafE family protein, partial [bacterium]
MSLTNFIKSKGLNFRWGYLFGFLSGLLGGAFNTNGPPILIYFYLQGWDKFKQKASITGFFIITSVVIVSTHAVTGITTGNVMKLFFYSLPAVVIGLFAGSRLFKKVSTEIFNKIILYGLIIIGIFMIFR